MKVRHQYCRVAPGRSLHLQLHKAIPEADPAVLTALTDSQSNQIHLRRIVYKRERAGGSRVCSRYIQDSTAQVRPAAPERPVPDESTNRFSDYPEVTSPIDSWKVTRDLCAPDAPCRKLGIAE